MQGASPLPTTIIIFIRLWQFAVGLEHRFCPLMVKIIFENRTSCGQLSILRARFACMLLADGAADVSNPPCGPPDSWRKTAPYQLTRAKKHF